MNIKDLSKDEKIKLKIELLNSDSAFMYHKASRMFTASLFGLVFSILLIMMSIFVEKELWEMIYDFGLFIFCAAIMYKTSTIKKQELNKFLREIKKKEEAKDKLKTEKIVTNKNDNKPKSKTKTKNTKK